MWSRLPIGDRLRTELGRPRRPRRLGSSPRSRVWSTEFAGTPAVVKQIVGGPDASARYAREVTALRLATRADPPLVPRLLGTDPGRLVLVLEHLTDLGPADDWVVGYAAGLARLHAVTRPSDAGVLPGWSGPGAGDIRAFLGLARMLGAPVRPSVSRELDDLVMRLDQMSAHSLLHGDPCPGNDLHTSAGIRFIDFEQASLGSGLVELAYLRAGFPTCWCVTETPESLLTEAEAAYRAAWRTATGTPPSGDLVDACAGWLIQGDALVQRAHRGTMDHLARIARQDWHWGTVTARQRLAHRLDVVARLASDHDTLAGLGRLSAAMRSRMLARWPGLRPPPSRRPQGD